MKKKIMKSMKFLERGNCSKVFISNLLIIYLNGYIIVYRGVNMSIVKKLITLDENIARELEIVAKVLNKKQREIIESAIDFYLDYMDAIIADKIVDEINTGKIKVYNNKEVYEKLGIDIDKNASTI
jgi:predicted transcriptional regulator